ncbi:MAG: glycoside hydrolase family 3 N-terminal domain-containing protein [Acidothermaceae bacterium]
MDDDVRRDELATQVTGVGAAPVSLPPWRDTNLPAQERVTDLLARMSVEEKIAQLYGIWVGADASGDGVAPHQHDLAVATVDWETVIKLGLGQLTRPFGTSPVDPALGARALARTQAEIVAASRHGIPALAHEECLSGFMTWGATIYPTPLAWGATFDPALVESMAAQVGAAMRRVGVHQGLAPVLDVTRDYRWGRVEETIGEDPYLVATVGTAYVRGLESSGIVATLKHFVGYSASRSGRNFGPVSAGPREVADVLLPPFEMAIRDGGARSVMHAYIEIDGVPAAANSALLTTLLRDEWGFTGTVVADYFGISFLHLLHKVAASEADAAALGITAGVDVELPTVHCYGSPLTEAVNDGRIAEHLVDRAARRVLLQKCELGLLDPEWRAEPPALIDIDHGLDGDVDDARGSLALDATEHRDVARQMAEESVVLVANSGALPIAKTTRMAVVGPRADDPLAMLGCYTFPSHVGSQHPATPFGVEVPTLLEALHAEFGDASITCARGCNVDDDDTSGFAEAVEISRAADVCIVALGDRAGLFGRGTSGEGCDVDDLQLPGVQAELVHALLQTGTPVVLVLVAGRPYALGEFADQAAAIVQSFFPGEEGGPALAGVLSGRVNPSGRLPVSLPRTPGGQPSTYLTVPLGLRSEVTNIDPTPLWPFGHGLSYTTFRWDNVKIAGRSDDAKAAGTPTDSNVSEIPTDGVIDVSVTVTNTGNQAGADVVQLYLHDPVAQVTRPDVRLVGYARVQLEPQQSAEVNFSFYADLSAFTGVDGRRVVEPGDLELRLSRSSSQAVHCAGLRLTGPLRVVDSSRHLVATATVR